MVISLTLMAITVSTIRSARGTGRTSATIATAHAYATGIDRFARDHGGRFPNRSPHADWPDAERGPVADILGVKRFYVPRVPETIQDGIVKLGPDATMPYLEYATENGGRGYRIEVHVPDRPPCALRGGATTSTTPTACTSG